MQLIAVVIGCTWLHGACVGTYKAKSLNRLKCMVSPTDIDAAWCRLQTPTDVDAFDGVGNMMSTSGYHAYNKACRDDDIQKLSAIALGRG